MVDIASIATPFPCVDEVGDKRRKLCVCCMCRIDELNKAHGKNREDSSFYSCHTMNVDRGPLSILAIRRIERMPSLYSSYDKNKEEPPLYSYHKKNRCAKFGACAKIYALDPNFGACKNSMRRFWRTGKLNEPI